MAGRKDVQSRIEKLQVGFKRYVDAYDIQTPFSEEQLRIHQYVINRRHECQNAANALKDEKFLHNLWRLLIKWRMANRGAKLIEMEPFKNQLQAATQAIIELEPYTITSGEDEFSHVVIPKLNELILNLGINQNETKVVVGTKTLHHILPDLVPPIDREYTGRFFGWHKPYFQYRQHEILSEGLSVFNKMAIKVHPITFIGKEWRTSQTKILDNAIVGYCIVENLPSPS